jgi:putative oxidoreductase
MESIGMLILRLTLGLIFVAHGLRQFFGLFGGGGMEDVIRRLGLRPAKLWASLAGLGNLCGGLMIALGAFTFLGCALIITTMLVAMLTIKAHSGFWERYGGYEYNLCVIGNTVAIALMGPGEISLDAVVAPELLRQEVFYLSLLVSLGVAGFGLYLRTNQAAQKSSQ